MEPSKLVILDRREALRPIGLRADTGALVTFAEYYADPALPEKVILLKNLDAEKKKEVAIADLNRQPEDYRVGVIPGREYTKDELIEEVRRASAVGLGFIHASELWIERVMEKISEGKYRLP